MATLFGHKVERISLFNLNPNSGELGFVEHTYNGLSKFQRLGCFFIGFSPLIVNPIVVILLLYFAGSDQLINPLDAANHAQMNGVGPVVLEYFSSSLFTITSLLENLLSNNLLFGLGLTYVMISFSLHCVPSIQDLKGSITGVWIIFIGLFLLALIYFVINYFVSAEYAKEYITSLMSFFTLIKISLFLSVSIALIMASFGLCLFGMIAIIAHTVSQVKAIVAKRNQEKIS